MDSPVRECETYLTCTQGANKFYQLWLEPVGNSWSVMACWGAINGGHTSTGAKTPTPVARANAEKVFQKTLKEKLAKGYKPAGDNLTGTTYVTGKTASEPSSEAADTGLYPMLLTAATEDDLEKYLTDDTWGAEEKMNGKRILLSHKNGLTVGSNRRGLVCNIPTAVQEAFSNVDDCVLDGELIGQTYHVFDCLEGRLGDNHRSCTTEDRAALACAFVSSAQSGAVQLVPLITGTQAKRQLFANLRTSGAEGIVFKRLDAPYESGRCEKLAKATAVKIKFYKTLSCFIMKQNAKNSIEVGVLDAAGQPVSIGNITVPAKYAPQIKVGGIIEVRYLYGTANSQLYQGNLQPNDSGSVVRDDLTAADCLLSQLRHEGVEE